jgi:hypothetical protein
MLSSVAVAKNDRIVQKVLAEAFSWTMIQGVILVFIVINSEL